MPKYSLGKIISASAEAELLVHCARLEIDQQRAERIRLLAGSNLNWTRLLSLAQRNALIPLLSFQLSRVAANQAPPDQLKQLRDRSQSNAALNVLLTGEMVRLLELFEASQIPAVPYKGPAIGVGIYGNLALRQFADLDILVPDKDVWKATELLIGQAYQAHFTIPARKQSSFIRLGYVRLFKHKTETTTVELHWRLAPRFFGAEFDTSRLWQSARRLELQGSRVRVPSPEDLILMLCIHGAKDCWEKLEWVCGLAELVRSETEVDWPRVLGQAKEIRCLKIASLGLVLAHEMLDAPIPADVLGQFSSRKQLDSLVDQTARRFFSENPGALPLTRRVKFHLAMKDSLGAKFSYCARLALTTTPVDWELVQLPEAVSFLYFPLRALRLLRKYGADNGRLAAKRRSIGPV
ncbi:MAG: nucleotidyltransferase domain-containing protein [Pyrinomonadaceae bacterium]